jgi:hypothetical protein
MQKKNLNVTTEDHLGLPGQREFFFLVDTDNRKILTDFCHLLAGSAESHHCPNLTQLSPHVRKRNFPHLCCCFY